MSQSSVGTLARLLPLDPLARTNSVPNKRGQCCPTNAVPNRPSPAAFDPNEPLFCICQRPSFGPMVGCDGKDCKYEWFHFECVGLVEEPVGDWYCPDCQALMAKNSKKRKT